MANLLKNVRVNFFAFLAGKAAAALVGLVLPRFLGVEKMGLYTSAWGLAALVSVLSDLGLAGYLTREVSRARHEAGAYFYRAMAVQLIQVSLAALVLALFIFSGKAPGLSAALVALAFIVAALASMGNPFSATLQGLESFTEVGIVNTVASLMNAAALGIVLWVRPEPAMAFAALAVSGALGLLLWLMTLARLGILHAAPSEWKLWEFFRGALPFAMVSAANLLYAKVDLAILTVLLGASQLGHYGVAVKLVDLMVALMGSLAGPLYPRLSAEFGVASLQRALRYLSALCLPLGVGGSLLATPLMSFLYGEAFSESGRAFRWMVWVPALVGVHGTMLHAMNALGKTKLIALMFLVNLVLNVGLNFMLIPHYGFEAAAALSTLCEVVVLISSAWVLAKAGYELKLKRWLWPALPAALGMGLLLWLLPAPVSFQTPLWVLTGALAYGGLLWVLGFFGDEERMHLRRLLGREE